MQESALVIHPFLKKSSGTQNRTTIASLEEAAGLAEAISLKVSHASLVPLSGWKSATCLGKGKLEEFAKIIQENDISITIVNTQLSPIQQRNLEKLLGCKVIDRTALILEIFGKRAQTKEGRLQVELAALEYQKSRLVRSWTHLERQRGGYGFTGGPGESQIEMDRRIIRDRITVIKKQIGKVVKTRNLHRKLRKDTPFPLIALAGYTNAGKSTLFNLLTRAEVLSEDALFATLDPTIRKVTLPSGMEVLFSDTVGFISELPTELVAAFKATLEEVCEADLIIHVRDIANPDTEAQKQDVEEILKNLLPKDAEPPILEALNKTDLLDGETKEKLLLGENRKKVAVSALGGDGVNELLEQIEDALSNLLMQQHHFTINCANGKAIAWLYQHGNVLSNTEEDGFCHIEAKLTNTDYAIFNKHYA